MTLWYNIKLDGVVVTLSSVVQLYTVHSVHSTQCTQYIVYTVHSVHSTQYTVYTVQCTLYSVHCTVYPECKQYTMETVHSLCHLVSQSGTRHPRFLDLMEISKFLRDTRLSSLFVQEWCFSCLEKDFSKYFLAGIFVFGANFQNLFRI